MDKMNCTNIDETWEIVYDGGAGFIGSVIESEDGWVRMCPVFHYLSSPNVKPAPDGMGTEFGANARIVFPIEMMGSNPAPIIRFSRRIELKGFDEYDLRIYDSLVGKGFELRRGLLASRIGITLESEMPRNPPPRSLVIGARDR